MTLPRCPRIRTTWVLHEGALIRPLASYTRCDGRRGTRASCVDFTPLVRHEGTRINTGSFLEAIAPRYAATEGKKRGTPRKMETTTLMQVPLLLPQREKVAEGRMRGPCRQFRNGDCDDDFAALSSHPDDPGTPRGRPHPVPLSGTTFSPLRREKGYMNELRRSHACGCTTEPA